MVNKLLIQKMIIAIILLLYNKEVTSDNLFIVRFNNTSIFFVYLG